MLIRDLHNEIGRELSLRRVTFPKLIQAGRLTQGEADERTDRMQAALALLARALHAGCLTPSDVIDRIHAPTQLNTESGKVPSNHHIKGGGQ